MTIPSPVEGTVSEVVLRKFLARYKVGIREFELTPKINDIVHECIGGRFRAIETLKFSSNPSARALLEFCSKFSPDKINSLPIEALCLAAKVEVATIAGALIMASRDVWKMKSALNTMRLHPQIVEETAFNATRQVLKNSEGVVTGIIAGSEKAQEMFHKAVGWLPTPKGSSVNVNVFDPHKSAEDDDDSEAPSLDAVFDNDPREIENWGDSRRKLLESGK